MQLLATLCGRRYLMQLRAFYEKTIHDLLVPCKEETGQGGASGEIAEKNFMCQAGGVSLSQLVTVRQHYGLETIWFCALLVNATRLLLQFYTRAFPGWKKYSYSPAALIF
jgi:hypothetical protein